MPSVEKAFYIRHPGCKLIGFGVDGFNGEGLIEAHDDEFHGNKQDTDRPDSQWILVLVRRYLDGESEKLRGMLVSNQEQEITIG